jgi:hypothetical protein
MATKPSRVGSGGSQRIPPEESQDGVPKPLAATLLQEFQNLKDKFKNEDDIQEKGSLYLNYISRRIYYICEYLKENKIFPSIVFHLT